jgi:hypothetical protein
MRMAVPPLGAAGRLAGPTMTLGDMPDALPELDDPFDAE